ncbi:MAG: hypothetical protein ACRDIB_12025, partial [Ardenticatenaceae bacterium]
ELAVERRHERAHVAASLWPHAVRYGKTIANLPFVRMVTVTGALAVDNVDPGADIDYLIVTEPGRLWFCRLLVVSLVRLAARQGSIVCPNYFLSERALVLQERNLFTARELVQMVPVAGLATYELMRRLNPWATSYLPNADGPPPKQYSCGLTRIKPIRRLAEMTLRFPLLNRLERWEMDRKVRKFNRRLNGHAEANFSPDWCKGHFDGHGRRILHAYGERLQTLDAAQ